MKHMAALLSALALAGCVGNGVEYGGVANPSEIPAKAQSCKKSGVRRADPGHMFIPDEVPKFFMAAQQYQATKSMLIRYDVNESGKALNVRYVGPPEQLKHTTWQKLIRAASDFVQTSTYAWPETPGFATGCELELSYIIDWRSGLGG